MQKPNLVFLLVDQLRAASLPLYGEKQIATPNLDRLAAEGITCQNALSTVPICTPYRAMLLTGRHPQSTGMVGNFLGMRHDEIGIGDAFSAAGYQTAWIGKWHLQVGAWPGAGMREGSEGACYIPEGRQRLGFKHWRGYNFHEHYFNGWVDKNNWRNEIWDGYETQALNRYAFEFMDNAGNDPFCVFLSPHQPHHTTCDQHAPEKYYQKLPDTLHLPANVPDSMRPQCLTAYRDYLAMILALDDMLGELMDYLAKSGRADNTLLVFTSDHGSQFGAQGHYAWMKATPCEESVRVPMVLRLPGNGRAGSVCDSLITPVDIFPTLCGLCGVPKPRTVEGMDLSQTLLGHADAPVREEALLMGFSDHFCFFELTSNPPGQNVWRAIRTRNHKWIRRYGGTTELYDLSVDPLEMTNLAGRSTHKDLQENLDNRLDCLMRERNDQLNPGDHYLSWFDSQRRVIANAFGKLPHPESPPDFSRLA